MDDPMSEPWVSHEATIAGVALSFRSADDHEALHVTAPRGLPDCLTLTPDDARALAMLLLRYAERRAAMR